MKLSKSLSIVNQLHSVVGMPGPVWIGTHILDLYGLVPISWSLASTYIHTGILLHYYCI